MINIEAFLTELKANQIFVTLDKGALRCKAPKGALDAATQKVLKENKALIVDYLQKKEILKSPISVISRNDPLPVSYTQQRLWFLAQLEADEQSNERSSYNMPYTWHLAGSLNKEALIKSFEHIYQRHEVFRTHFPSLEGKPTAKIMETAGQVDVISLTHLVWDEIQNTPPKELQKLVDQEALKPFNLDSGPLVRTTLFEINPNSNVLMVVLHHIIADGWSIGIFFGEITRLYAAYSQGKKSPLRDLEIQYLDFAHWQKQWLSGAFLDQMRHYWKQQLTHLPTLLHLPTDYPRPPKQRFKGALTRIQLSQSLVQALNQLSQANRCTLFMTLISTLGILLSRYSGQKDIVIGTPIANRKHPQLEELIGFFANTLVLRLQLEGLSSFEAVLQKVKTTALEAYDFQDLPFEQLVEEIQPERSLSHSPLFQVMFVLQNAAATQIEFSDLVATTVSKENVSSKFDLVLFMQETEQGLAGFFEYNTDLFALATVERMAKHFLTLLENVVYLSKVPLASLPLLTKEERYSIQNDWDMRQRQIEKTKCFLDLFEEQVGLHPDAEAILVCSSGNSNKRLSYNSLNEKANQLAYYLRALGVGPEVPVICYLDRSFELIVSLLGVLKSGGAFVCIVPEHSNEQKRFILDDSDAPLIVTKKRFVDTLPPHQKQVVYLDGMMDAPNYTKANLSNQTQAEHLAAYAYPVEKSVSTLGISFEHRSFTAMVEWARTTFPPQQLSGVLAKSILGTTHSFFEIFVPLCVGGTLVLPDGATLPSQLPDDTVTWLTVTPDELRGIEQAWCQSLKVVQICGETFSNAVAQTLYQKFPSIECLFHSTYCPESTVGPTFTLIKRHGGQFTKIGQVVDSAGIAILDETLNPVPEGAWGEMYLGGTGVTRGFVNGPGQTAECLVPNPFLREAPWRLFKTGQWVRYVSIDERAIETETRSIEFLGRSEQRGFRKGYQIEPTLIERQLAQFPGVHEIAILDATVAPKESKLIAYVVHSRKDQSALVNELNRYLENQLPSYLLPSSIVLLNEMPFTSNGNVDYGSLPRPPVSSQTRKLPESDRQIDIENTILSTWKNVLQLEQIGVHDNFFEIGGNSLNLVQLRHELQNALNWEMKLMDLFKNPTIQSMVHHVANVSKPDVIQWPKHQPKRLSDNPKIAIIGMAGRFPKSHNLGEFWEKLCDGEELITTFSNEELRASGVAESLITNPHYVKANGILDKIEYFDAYFFDYSPREAELMDPQQRLFLECAWEVLEDAGYDIERMKDPVGVFAGMGYNTYLIQNILKNPDFFESASALQARLGNESDFLPMRVSYKLNLKGPAINVQTACSTALVAVHTAIQNLMNGECAMALVGGAQITTLTKTGYLYQSGMIFSPDGHCRAFDKNAEGTVDGSGVGCVLLKPLEHAMTDNDSIYAVIIGSAINNDGSVKVGFTAPSVEGQAAVIAKAMNGIDYETIDYIETHGTGTPLGDPIEISALTQAYREHTEKIGFCAIGSVKTNVGHTGMAAGVFSLIKAALALKHKKIPPSLHFKEPNPHLDLPNSPFFVNTQLQEWKVEKRKRRASVSSFGVGGTNAHIILEEAPPEMAVEPSENWQLFLFSAKTETALEQVIDHLKQYRNQNPEVELAQIAYTLSLGRKFFEHKAFMVCRATEETPLVYQQSDSERSVIFMFSGQGSQYVGMGQELYQTYPTFQTHVDKCAEFLIPHLELDIRTILFPSIENRAIATEKLEQICYTLPALFTIEYALAKLWMSWGVYPSAMIGYSIGEYMAACLAGVFSLEDALSLVALRGKLMHEQPPGEMLTVYLSETEVAPFLNEDLSLALHNGPSLCIVSGTHEAIANLKKRLESKGEEYAQLPAYHAYHSFMMVPAMEPLKHAIQSICRNPPQIPYISNFSGSWITEEEAVDPEYWANHMRYTVRFSDGLQELLKKSNMVLLEVGPGKALTTLVKRFPAEQKWVFPSMGTSQTPEDDVAFLLNTLGQLWLQGVSIDWASLFEGGSKKRIALPTYPFERDYYWIVPQPSTKLDQVFQKKLDVADWCYVPIWKEAPYLKDKPNEESPKPAWLIFSDTLGVGDEMVDFLKSTSETVIVVKPGNGFKKYNDAIYELNPMDDKGYHTLFTDLKATQRVPTKIFHLWNVTPDIQSTSPLERLEETEKVSFFSIDFLVKALYQIQLSENLKMVVVSNHLQEVWGDETLHPEKAILIGQIRVIPFEMKNIRCCSLDIQFPLRQGRSLSSLVRQILWEGRWNQLESIVALRGKKRWAQTFEAQRMVPNDSFTNLLRPNGVYLIVGGLGGVGLEIAKSLAEIMCVHLVLIGRSPFPEKEAWGSILNEERHPLVSKIKKLQTIETLGSKVMVLHADVAEENQMAQLVDTICQEWGPINGVIHAACVWSNKSRNQKSVSFIQDLLAAKVRGTLILDKLLCQDPLDFFVMFASINGVLGGAGQAEYCGANVFQDAFAVYRNRLGQGTTVSIEWDQWQEVGLAREYAETSPKFKETLLQRGILSQEGIELFQRILVSGVPNVLISTFDLLARIQKETSVSQKVTTKQDPDLSATGQRKRPSSKMTKRKLKTTYVAPRNEIERQLAEIWQTLSGVEAIGVFDNFFEIGIDSLLALQCLPQLKKVFGKKVTLATITKSPSIHYLAQFLSDGSVFDNWSPLVLIQPKGNGVPLFCVHPGGGNVWCYSELGLLLKGDFPVYGLQCYGVEEGQTPYTSVEEMATIYLKAIQTAMPEGPYRLLGWSFGGLVAYEMAKRLERQKQNVSFLGILDISALPTENANYDSLEDDASLLHHIFSTPQTPLSLDHLKQCNLDQQLHYVVEQIHPTGIYGPDFDVTMAHRLFLIYRSNIQALRNYQPASYQGDVALFLANQKRSDTFPLVSDSGWKQLITGNLTTCWVDGTHHNMVTSPHVQKFVQKLKACLGD